jgi:hypothetical protein
MKKFPLLLAIIGISTLTLSACGGRSVNKNWVQHNMDHLLTCEHFKQELAVNKDLINDIIKEQDSVSNRNIAVVLNAVIDPAKLLHLDNGDVQELELATLENRNITVVHLMKNKKRETE